MSLVLTQTPVFLLLTLSWTLCHQIRHHHDHRYVIVVISCLRNIVLFLFHLLELLELLEIYICAHSYLFINRLQDKLVLLVNVVLNVKVRFIVRLVVLVWYLVLRLNRWLDSSSSIIYTWISYIHFEVWNLWLALTVLLID